MAMDSVSTNLSRYLPKALETDEEPEIDHRSVIGKILGSYRECEEKDILPVFFVALYAFRHFNTWCEIVSENDVMSSVVAPILREFMTIPDHIKFKCLNSTSTASGNRKVALAQDGQARQPDIVGRTREKREVYYGEIKGTRPTIQSKNADSLRIAIFTKDSLDSLLPGLEEDLPLISFQSVGPEIVFFLGAMIGNTVIHAKISELRMPTCSSELRSMDQVFFLKLFQIQSLVRITSKRLKGKRQKHVECSSFPTLGTPFRNMSLGIRSKLKVKRGDKNVAEEKELKRKKRTA
ncbi:hypothetical protein BCR41DRAFT_151879 [Lobosporangium transversale]|uniref:Uncharacterized protein n=1 Tax=Lobosporangium transversale TaxID=64571 RepID=A0A1Y2GY54_9FUNG|nr:hypothetical protein BCR41DRAFT_151879 [Lobosporangium transversale]ORZ27238.1 hypothetical protein BCR41DRAFT_151879 [Lobosporangium transversale]|eukprot:XP_021884965.1 hypothetical protein BCR41DRAFT_151879 [Lobosporangium transversale]